MLCGTSTPRYTSPPFAQLPNYLEDIGAAACSRPDSDFSYAQTGTAKNTSQFQKFKLGVNEDHNLFFENLIEIQTGLCSARALVSLRVMIMQL